MTKIPKVSIITVVFNGEAHLEQTIQSVLWQDYPNFEYIIIDGGSTDKTLDIIAKYEDYITYWVSEPDDGIYDAMNKGIKAASGEVIGLIHADDWYAPGTVSWVVDIMAVSGADVVHGAMNILKEDGKSIIKQAPKNLDKLAKGMLLNHPTVFARASLYEKFGLFDTAYAIAADWGMILRWWMNDATFYADDKVMANFRMGGTSSVHLKKSFEEKHTIRRKHTTYRLLDHYYIYDRMKHFIPAEVLLRISLHRQSKANK